MTRTVSRVKIRFVTLLVATTLVSAACSGGGDEAEPSPTPTPVVTLSPTPTPTPTPVEKSWLTGVGARTTEPVIGLKVDNAPTARPFHRGLGQAAVVYVELVEGGSTRFLAVYDGAPDVEVGPIRSVRESDLELLGQYGAIGLGFSGGNDGVLRTVRRAVSAGELTDVSFDALPAAYRLGERRVDARNFFSRPSVLAELKPSAAPSQDIGLRFSPKPRGGTAAAAVRTTFSPRYALTIRWNAAKGTYSLVQQGQAITGAAPQNVVIQRVPVRDSAYVDKLGTPTPYTDTVGRGSATVLRDGKKIAATWVRGSDEAPTRYRDAAGRDVALHPGRTWVLLVPTSGSVSDLG